MSLAALQLIEKAPTLSYRTLHELADRFEPRVRKAFLEAVGRLQGSVTIRQLQEAVESRNVNRVIDLLGWNQFDSGLRSMTDTLRAGIIEAGILAGGSMVGVVGRDLRFDILNPASVSFIRQYEFDLIRSISEETRNGIRAIVQNAFEEGGHPYQQAREIRMLIGLTERQMNAVSNYWDTLLETDMSATRAEELAMRYYGRLLNYRAKTIARTETIRAAGMGREALWAQAVEEGLLNPITTRRSWLVTPDDRLCPVCQAIPQMNPGGVRLMEDFQSPVGLLDQEPAHPNCRCSVVLTAF